MKRKLKIYILTALTVILAACAIAAGVIYWRSARYLKAAAEFAAYPEKITMGENFSAVIDCRLPYGYTVQRVDYTPPEGLVHKSGEVNYLSRCRLSWRDLRLELKLRAYHTGKIEPGTVQIWVEPSLLAAEKTRQLLEVKLPEITVEPLAYYGELAVGGEVQVPQSKWLYIVTAAAVLLAAILIIWWFVHRGGENAVEILPPWVIARSEIASLQQSAAQGKQPLNWCVAKLCDVVRDYLSARFDWPVKQQTTDEFLRDLCRKRTPLTSDDVRALTEFMNVADLVKFARMKPDIDYFNTAAAAAGELIDRTSEIPEDGVENVNETREVEG